MHPIARAIVVEAVERGLEVVLLSGDHTAVAERIAAEAGVTNVMAEVDPAGKATWVRGGRGVYQSRVTRSSPDTPSGQAP